MAGVGSALQFADWVRSEVKRCLVVCDRAGMTDWQIANRIGVHRSTVQVWKNAKDAVNPLAIPFKALQALAEECEAKKARVA